MKFIHTADWHLGWKYKGRDFSDAILAQVQVLADIATERGADAMIVAGDVFEKRRDVSSVTRRVVEILAPCVRGGMHLLLVPGNHDDVAHFEMMEALLALESPSLARRVHILRREGVVEIKGVQFGAVPYPTREWFLDRPVEAASPQSAASQNRSISQALADQVAAVCASFDASKRAVLVAHVTVAGVTTPGGYEIEIWDDLRLGRESLPPDQNIAYIALGHIHQQQKLANPIEAWYCGSIERLNMGERDDQKGALWVEVPQVGNATATPIPLDATPFYDLQIRADEVDLLAEKYPDLDRAFVKVQVTDAGEHEPAALGKVVRAACPNLVDIEIVGERREHAGLRVHNLDDRESTVLDYLGREFKDDPDLPQLLERARKLMPAAFAPE